MLDSGSHSTVNWGHSHSLLVTPPTVIFEFLLALAHHSQKSIISSVYSVGISFQQKTYQLCN